MDLFVREKYLKKIRGFYHSEDIIKVITGVLPNTSTTLHGMMSTSVGQAAELSRRENRTVFIEELFRD